MNSFCGIWNPAKVSLIRIVVDSFNFAHRRCSSGLTLASWGKGHGETWNRIDERSERILA